MKTIKFLTLCVIATAMMAVSCKKASDPENTTPTANGSIILDGKTYTVSYGFLVHSGSEFIFTFSDAKDVISGNVEATFAIIPPTGTLDNGTYTYNPNHTSNLIEAFLRLKEGQNEAEWLCYQTGSITISKTGDVYDISFTYIGKYNSVQKTITGSFKGAVTNY